MAQRTGSIWVTRGRGSGRAAPRLHPHPHPTPSGVCRRGDTETDDERQPATRHPVGSRPVSGGRLSTCSPRQRGSPCQRGKMTLYLWPQFFIFVVSALSGVEVVVVYVSMLT